MTKPTKRDYFNQILAIPAIAESEELTAFISHELELLAKKNSAERKPTAQQTENESIKEVLLNAMEVDKAYTISEILKLEGVPEMTNQRCSALIRQLKDDGMVIRSEDKRKAYFTKAA